MSAERSTLSSLFSGLLRWNGLRSGGLDPGAASAGDLCELLAEVNDEILERAGTSMDEAAGLRKGERDQDGEDGGGGRGPVMLEVAEKSQQSR